MPLSLAEHPDADVSRRRTFLSAWPRSRTQCSVYSEKTMSKLPYFSTRLSVDSLKFPFADDFDEWINVGSRREERIESSNPTHSELMSKTS